MWLMVFFDLPTTTKKEKKRASSFRKRLIKQGFSMLQYSIYIRHSSSRENSEVHMKRVRMCIPPAGEVAMLQITDKQFGTMAIFRKQSLVELPSAGKQLEMF